MENAVRNIPNSKFSWIILLISLSFTDRSAFAEIDTSSANLLMPACREWAMATAGSPLRGDPMLRGLCVGTIDGIFYVDKKICPPPNASKINLGQIARVVVQYIDNHPARMHEDFKKLALEAMRAAWPCQQ
jgi:hypothetical protein